MNFITRVPEECSAEELLAFKNMVEMGNKVQSKGLEGRIGGAIRLIFAYEDEILLGTAAIKRPADHYRDGVFKKAQADARPDIYNHELGWVFVAEKARGRHLSRDLSVAALSSLESQHLFATTHDDNQRMQRTLSRLEFAQVGQPFAGRENKKLILYLREPQK